MRLSRRPKVDRSLNLERKPQRLIVFAPDLDRIFVPDDVDVMRLGRKLDGIGERPEMLLYLLIASGFRKPELLPHGVPEPVVLEKVLTGVRAEVDKRHKNRQLDEATKPARSASHEPRNHHWDCAP